MYALLQSKNCSMDFIINQENYRYPTLVLKNIKQEEKVYCSVICLI